MWYTFFEVYMENQINNGEQNIQQIEQNSVSQPNLVPKRSKKLLTIGGIILTCFVIFGFGGYYLGKKSVNSSRQYTNYLKGTPESSPTQQLPSPSALTTVSLKIYTSSLEKISFKYPSDWKPYTSQPRFNLPRKSNVPGGDALEIQDPAGKVGVTWVSAIDGLGGSCDPNIPFNQTGVGRGAPCPLYEVVDKQKLSNADLYLVAYIVTRDEEKYESIYALQDQNGLLSTKRAMGYLFFQGRNNGNLPAELVGGGLKSGTKEDAQAFFSTPEAIQVKDILLSATY